MNPNSKHRLTRLNKRQQKKARVGAFQEFGFGIIFKFKTDTAEELIDQTLDQILTCIDHENANFSGYCDGSIFEGMVLPLNRKKITEESRQKIIQFLQTLDHIESLSISEFTDAWH